MQPMSLRESLGRVAGVMLSPLVAVGTWLRDARLAHPSGVVCGADVVPHPHPGDPALAALAARFAGGAIIRFSGGFWRRIDAPEPLGCAIRFRGPRPLVAEATAGDQDLITATTSLYHHDYLRRPYYAFGPFDLDALHGLAVRLMPVENDIHPGRTRRERLLAAMSVGRATLRMEIRPRADQTAPWLPLCDIRALEVLPIDQEDLGFSPWRTGLGLVPRGALQAFRAAIYPAGLAARRLTGAAS